MPVDPQVSAFLADQQRRAVTPVEMLTPDEVRSQLIAGSALLGPGTPVSLVANRQIPGQAGPIRLRIYYPSGQRPLAVVIYYHGGGFVAGSLDTHDGYCRALAKSSASIVVSVDYRLAPEHRYPAAVEDAYAAFTWVAHNAAEIGADPRRLVVAGDSAGGNLAAVVALMARDRNGPSINLQVLVYPVTDRNLDTGSYREFGSGYYLTRAAMQWFWGLYHPNKSDVDKAGQPDPYLTPLAASDLRGLPPAMVITAECDVLRDEGEAYAEKMKAAGVPVTLTRYAGMIHGFTRRLTWGGAKQALAEVADAIQQHTQHRG